MKYILSFFLLVSVFTHNAFSQTPAFPGAEGCGKYTKGGRGGRVVYVTNLNDNGTGSLRYALSEVDGPRIILFKVSGTIFLEKKIDISKGDFTIAGQTAPGDGICIAGYGFDIEADNFIVRYMRFRPGDIAGKENDALTIKRSNNVIVDHCSMSWSTDETASCYDNTGFTMQWCIISESLNNSVHPKGAHGYGGIWGGKKATFHHNLLAHHKSRNPRLQGSRYHKEPKLEQAEIVNNVIYNWKSKCIYGGENGNYSIMNNYIKPGPATGDKAGIEILETYKPFSNFFFQNNMIDKHPVLTKNNHLAIDIESGESLDEKWLDQALAISGYRPVDALKAFDEVVENAGACLQRDVVDRRIVEEVKKGISNFGDKGIIDSQKEVGGWPELKTTAPPADSDHDGMPDEWETSHQLDPENAADGTLFTLNPGYTNIEVYINSLCSIN